MRRLDTGPEPEGGEAPGPRSKTLGARVPLALYERARAFAASFTTPRGTPGDTSPIVLAVFEVIFDPARLAAVNGLPGATFAERLTRAIDGGLSAAQHAEDVAQAPVAATTETPSPSEGGDGG